MHNLVVILGDRLDLESAAFDGVDAGSNLIWIAAVPEESARVWPHKARSELFVPAMRHFAAMPEERALPAIGPARPKCAAWRRRSTRLEK